MMNFHVTGNPPYNKVQPTTKETMIKISTHSETSKMKYIKSISTSPLTNKNCNRNRKVDGSVCQKCYSHTYNKLRPSLRNALLHNTKELTTRVLDNSELPYINAAFFRLESFGDLHNRTHLENYRRLAVSNPQCHFSLWTKNPELLKLFSDPNTPKPKNLKIIYSSLMLNERANISGLKFVDKVFTVYTKEFIKENGIKINCGSNYCMGCKKCYGNSANRIKYINELKKIGRAHV